MALYYQFGQLFEITFMSDYFSDNVFRNFTMEQATSDQSLTATKTNCPGNKDNFGCWYNFVSYPFDGTAPLKGFTGYLRWNFLLRLTDTASYDTKLAPLPPTMDAEKTDQNGQIQLNYYFFSNHDENFILKPSGLLTTGAAISTQDLLVSQSFYKNYIRSVINPVNTPFALISMIWDSTVWKKNQKTVPDPNNSNKKIKKYKPPGYQVSFPK